MADSTGKPASRASQNLLSILGTVAGVAGNLILGPDSVGMDLGAPFKAGAAMLKEKKDKEDLMNLLRSTPATAPLADHIPAIINAGGLIKNPDILSHPDTQSYMGQFGSGVPNPPPGPQMQGVPNPSTLGASNSVPAPMQAPTPGPIQSPIAQPTGGLLSALQPKAMDMTSPEFLQKAAQYRPDIAEKIIVARGSKEKDPGDEMHKMLQTILLGKQIQDYETPEQKRQAAEQDRITTLQAADVLSSGRAKEARRDKAAAMAPTERQSLESIDNSIVHMQALPDQLSMGDVTAANVAAKHPSLASFIPGNGPNAARIMEGLQASKIQFASALKGARINDKTIQAMTASFPDPTKNPELWPQMKQQVIARMNLAKLVQLSHLTDAGKTESGLSDGTPMMDPNQKADFDVWFKTFEKYGQGALKSPQFQNLTKQFGLESLFINPTTPISK